MKTVWGFLGWASLSVVGILLSSVVITSVLFALYPTLVPPAIAKFLPGKSADDFNLAIVFIGILQAGIFSVQAGIFLHQANSLRKAFEEAKRSGDAAQRSATAATEAARTMREAAENELRAYIDVASADATGFVRNGEAIGFGIEIRNYGKTPASNLIVTVHSESWDRQPLSNEIERIIARHRGKQVRAADLSPGASRRWEFEHHIDDEKEFDDIRRGMKSVYVIGQIEFRDAFANTRRFWFCFKYQTQNETGVSKLEFVPNG